MATTMLISASHYLENGSPERLFEIDDPRLVLNGVSKNSMLTVVRYDSVCLTCSKKLTGSQLSLPHGKEAFRDRSGLVVCPRGPARGAENVPQQAYHWETLCQSCTDQLVYLFVPHAKLDCARRAQTLASHLNQKWSEIRIQNSRLIRVRSWMSAGSLPKCCGFIHYVVGVSHFAKYRKNRPVTEW